MESQPPGIESEQPFLVNTATLQLWDGYFGQQDCCSDRKISGVVTNATDERLLLEMYI